MPKVFTNKLETAETFLFLSYKKAGCIIYYFASRSEDKISSTPASLSRAAAVPSFLSTTITWSGLKPSSHFPTRNPFLVSACQWGFRIYSRWEIFPSALLMISSKNQGALAMWASISPSGFFTGVSRRNLSGS